MTARKKDSIVLLIRCKDRKGIVARVSGLIHDFGGNILDSDHHRRNKRVSHENGVCHGWTSAASRRYSGRL